MSTALRKLVGPLVVLSALALAAPSARAAAPGGDAHGPIVNLFSFDYSGKNTEGGEYVEARGDHKMPAPFAMALLNFAVLLFLFFKFAAPGFRKMMRERHEQVANQLEESARLRDEAQARLTEYGQKVQNLDAEIAALVGSIRAEVEAEKARIIGEAEQRAARVAKDAEQQIQAELARVRQSLEREVTLTAIAAAEQILAQKATDADHRALAESFVQKLGQAPRPRA
jgi:F-type H+-transporting ATPase subunit b